MSNRAAIYCRISQDKVGAGLGVQRQEQDCRALADTLNLDVTEIIVDNDVSAYDRRKNRPGYQHLLQQVRGGQVDVVLAWHTDRLHRSPRELEDWIDACEAHGVTVHTVQAGPLDLATPSGRMVARQLGAVARYESEHKSERARAKYRQMAEAGLNSNGGHRPFGWNADRLTHHPTEAPVLREMYADVLLGRSLGSIVRDLDRRGVRSTTGRPYTIQALRYTLLSPRHAGLKAHRGQIVGDAVWPFLVDRETWEQARAILTDPHRPGVGRGTPYARRYLLTGYLRCGVCGIPLRPSRNADVQRFACRPDPGDGRCGKILIRYAPLEQHVVAVILARLEQQADLDEPQPEDPTEHLRQQIAAEEAKIDRLALAFADDGDALELRRAGQVVRARIADLRRQISQAAVQRCPAPLIVREAWDDYTLDQRREVVDILVERIDVAPAVRGLSRFDPRRLTIRWR